jgi:hypothetical protein
MPATNANAINYFSPAKWVVSTVAGEGTHTTIATALTAASSGDTIVIMPGTFTENPTLKAGVNLTAYGSDSSLNGTGNVIISGTCTLTGAGTVTISGIQLQTNSAALLAVTGSAASVVNLNNCYLNCTNNTGISYSSSSASSAINIVNCTGNLGTTGIGLFSHSSSGFLNFKTCYFTNSGGSSTANTCSAGQLNTFDCTFSNPLTYSSSNIISALEYTDLETNATNSISLTTSGTGLIELQYSYIASGSASAISIGTGTTVYSGFSIINSGATYCVTGAGTFITKNSLFQATNLINVTTQSGGAASGLTQGTAPSAGFLGEQIRSFNSSGQSSPATAQAFNITSISLSAGIWDVSGIGLCQFSGLSQDWGCAVTLSSATFPTSGDQAAFNQFSSGTFSYCTACVPSFRFTLSSTTTIYLVAYASYTSGGATATGRISATRVG